MGKDHLGSVRLVTDAAGALVTAARYGGYGERTPTLSSTTTREAKAYLGERQDETGLLFLNARYYDPVLARFVSPDWWDPTEPGVGTNRYAYAGNDKCQRIKTKDNQRQDANETKGIAQVR